MSVAQQLKYFYKSNFNNLQKSEMVLDVLLDF